MIYVDTSVVLAQLLAEDRHPPASLWQQSLVCSRLLEFEVWTRLHARRLASSHGDAARALMGRIATLELVSPVLSRALDPFPGEIRTLDALHLASIEFLRQRTPIRLATYDTRQAMVARAMGLDIVELAP